MNNEESGAARIQQLGSPSGPTDSFDGILRAPSSAETLLDATTPGTQGFSAPLQAESGVALNDSRLARRKLLVRTGFGVLAALLLLSVAFIIVRRVNRSAPVQYGSFSNVSLPLGEVSKTLPITLASSPTLNINGQLVVSKSIVISPSTQPAVPSTGQIYYDKGANTMSFYNGTQFVNMGGSIQSTTNVTNVIGAGGGTPLTAVGGTAGVIPKFAGAQSLGASIITDNGSSVSVGGALNLVTPSAGPQAPLQIWPDNPTPGGPASGDTNAVEVGVKIRSEVSGFVTTLRFYKGATNTGTHVGHLWSSSGVALATATFTNETASGWQEVTFSSPVPIAAETTYIASYHTDVGHYSFDGGYFTSGGHSNGMLHALQDGEDGNNGTFKYSATPTFPTQGYGGPNYWVDVIFQPNAPPARYQINGVQIASSDLANNADLAKRSSSQLFSGSNTFRGAVASTSAFSIQDVTGTPLLTADTTADQLFIGKAGGDAGGIILVLGIRTVAGDPPGSEGGMYYNSSETMFRCYRNAAWGPCANIEADHAFSVYDEFLGGQTSSFTGNIGSLGWTALAIGANGALSFNPTTPAPIGDRPGVLALQTPAVANQGTTLLLGTAGAGSTVIQKSDTVKMGVAVGAATNQVLRVGLHGETTSVAQPVSGAWWEANPALSANWRFCHGDGTTAFCSVSGFPIVANSWMRLEIRVTNTGNGTSTIDFGINGSFVTHTNATIDTTNRVSPAFSCFTTNGVAQNCYWDYYQMYGTTNSYR